MVSTLQGIAVKSFPVTTFMGHPLNILIIIIVGCHSNCHSSYLQNLVPVWNDLAKTFEDDLKVRISELDCTQAQIICQEQKVKGYPSLYYYHNGVQVQSYNGARFD